MVEIFTGSGGGTKEVPPTIKQSLQKRNEDLNLEVERFKYAIQRCKDDIAINNALIADIDRGTLSKSAMDLLGQLFAAQK